MAEPLALIGLVASLTQLIDYCTRLTFRLRDLGSASGEFSGLKARIVGLPGVLEGVRRQIRACTAHGAYEGLLPVVVGCTETVKRLMGMVEKVLGDKSRKLMGMEKFVRAVRALAMDKEFRRLERELGEGVQVISLWQTTLLVDLAWVGDGKGLRDAKGGDVVVAAREMVRSETTEAMAVGKATIVTVRTTALDGETATPEAMTVTGRPKANGCAAYCSCVCHRPYHLSTPSYLTFWTGHLSIASDGGRPTLRWPCTERHCQRRTTTNTRITYRLPDWLLPIALNLSLSSTALNTHVNLNTLRILPDTAEVFSVISRGDLAHLRTMFAAKQASIYDVSRSNWSLVHTAFTLGRMDMASFLVAEGADLTISATNGSNVIERAWFHAQKFTTEPGGYVLSDNNVLRNVDVDEFVSSQQYTIVHKVVLGLVKLPLEEVLRGSTRDIDVRDAQGATPLWWASAQGNLEAVRVLLSYGADQWLGAGLKQVPLHVARNADVARMLIAADGDGGLAGAVDELGRVPLHCYCYRQVGSNRELVQEVLSCAGVDVNAVAKGGQTPLHYAVMFGNVELLQPLLDAGADAETRMSNGLTPLLAGVRYDQAECVEMMLSRGAHISAVKDDGEGTFHLAARWAEVKCLEALAGHLKKVIDFSSTVDKLLLRSLFESRQLRSQELEDAFTGILNELAQRGVLRLISDDTVSASANIGPDTKHGYVTDLQMPSAFAS